MRAGGPNGVRNVYEFRALDGFGAENGHVGQRAADHGDFIAGVETWTGLAVLVDFVGHRIALGDAETEVVEELGDAGEEADAHDLVLGGFVDEGAEERAAGAQAFGIFADDDGADLGQVRAVKMERAAAEKLNALGFGFVGGDEALGYGEVADVFADFGVGAAQQRAVAGERVDEVVDVAGVLEVSLVDGDGRLVLGCLCETTHAYGKAVVMNGAPGFVDEGAVGFSEVESDEIRHARAPPKQDRRWSEMQIPPLRYGMTTRAWMRLKQGGKRGGCALRPGLAGRGGWRCLLGRRGS